MKIYSETKYKVGETIAYEEDPTVFWKITSIKKSSLMNNMLCYHLVCKDSWSPGTAVGQPGLITCEYADYAFTNITV